MELLVDMCGELLTGAGPILLNQLSLNIMLTHIPGQQAGRTECSATGERERLVFLLWPRLG